jgi:hypothetical protein
VSPLAHGRTDQAEPVAPADPGAPAPGARPVDDPAHAGPARRTGAGAPRREPRPVWRVAVAVGVVAFVVRVWVPGPTSQTVDEFVWALRADAFRQAVVEGDLGRASTSAVSESNATQPGVTTMWAGSAGHGVVVAAEALGIVERERGSTPDDRARILRASRSVVSLWCALALALLITVSSLLVGRRAAVAAGVLLAAEPFLVGHSHLLHTDALVTMFGALAVVALAAAGRDRRAGPDRRLVVLAGVAAGVALLTKLNAVPLLLGGAGVALVAQVDLRYRWYTELRRSALVGAAFLGVAGVTFFVAWPALWVNPWSELQRLPDSVGNLNDPHPTFFRGAVTTDPGPRYYLDALALRSSPWLFAGAAASVAVVAAHLVRDLRRSRREAAVRSAWPPRAVLVTLLLAPVPYALLIAFTGQKYDRYALPTVPFLALVPGVVVAVAAARWQERFGGRLLRPAALAATAAMLAVTLAAQPYAISYANPLAGGQQRARNVILLGWGEGLEVLGAEIRARERGRCDEVVIAAPNMYPGYVAMPCGRFASGLPVTSYDYVVRYISGVQRSPRDRFFPTTERVGRLVMEVEIGGVTYAQLWHIDR